VQACGGAQQAGGKVATGVQACGGERRQTPPGHAAYSPPVPQQNNRATIAATIKINFIESFLSG
jgi:hypothetical protein